jgi:hypothetical protein
VGAELHKLAVQLVGAQRPLLVDNGVAKDERRKKARFPSRTPTDSSLICTKKNQARELALESIFGVFITQTRTKMALLE